MTSAFCIPGKLFSGNPAAVVLLTGASRAPAPPSTDSAYPSSSPSPWPPAAWMQALATELTFPATACVRAREDGQWGVRWFNPAIELPMCGHGSLAVAHTLFTSGAVPPLQRVLHLRAESSGAVVEAHLLPPSPEDPRPHAATVRLVMPGDPPADVSPEEATELRPLLLRALGLPAADLGSPEPLVRVARSRLDMVVHLAPAAFEALQPDFAKIAAIPGARILTVTTRGGKAAEGAQRGGLNAALNGHPTSAYDIVSRCFQPRNGVPEDPVCGAAHCQLASFWMSRAVGAEPVEGARIEALQASPRGGRLVLQQALDIDGRILLEGTCAARIVGHLSQPAPAASS